MKRHLIVYGIVIILLTFGLCGCTEQEISGDTDEIELLEYSIVTQKYDEEYKTIGNGFIHSDEAEFYLINGILKNIANEILINVSITAKFYNNTNNLLYIKYLYYYIIILKI